MQFCAFFVCILCIISFSYIFLVFLLLKKFHYPNTVLLSPVIGPIDIVKLWNPFYRIRLIMGKFVCTQIRTSCSCSCEKKKDFLNLFFWVWNILPRGLIGLLTKTPKKNLGYFCTLKRTFLANKWGFRSELGQVLGSNVPLAVLIDP